MPSTHTDGDHDSRFAAHGTSGGPANSSGAGRDLSLDLIRTAALVIVVAWHWAFTTIHWDDGPRVGNPVGVTWGLWAATWVLQPMAAFFAVGGLLHLRAYRGDPRAFWTKRARRLVVPTLALLVPAGLIVAAAVAAGNDAIVRTVVLGVSPLWFLAVYLVLIALAPAAIAAHRRWPAVSVAALALAVVAIDVARFGGGWDGMTQVAVAFVVVWGFVHQLGFHFDTLRQASMGARVAVTAGGFVALSVAVVAGPYSKAMVGVPGEDISNFAPPTVAVACLAVFQLGLLACLAGPLRRLAERHAPQLAVAGRYTMPLYVWHLVAYGAFCAALVAIGFDISSTPNGGWWASRPLWILGPALLAVPLCRLAAGRHRHPATEPTG